MSFDAAINKVLKAEGGYVSNPSDSGGATNFGITERVARANGWTAPMDQLSEAFAKAVYRKQYWDTLRLDDIASVSETVAEELFDTAVNAGIGTAGQFLQRALNVLNRSQHDYPDMKVDGIVGPVTVYALRRFLELRSATGESVLLKALNALQGAYYIELAERQPKDEAFEFGWLSNRVWH